jgi:hypothetical protein
LKARAKGVVLLVVIVLILGVWEPGWQQLRVI